MARGSGATWLLVGVLVTLLVVGAASVFAFFLMCGGMVWTAAPTDVIVEQPLELDREFAIEAPMSHETAREILLAFEVEYPVSESRDPEWALDGWIEVEGVRFDLDIAPGSDGVVGMKTDWEGDLDLERWYAWAGVEGDLVIAALPIADSEGTSSTITGQIHAVPGIEVVNLALRVRE